MNKAVTMAVGGVLIAAAAFGGGYFLSRGAAPAGAPDRGAFAQLTEDERAKLQTMSADEREAFFEEKGIDMPAGAPMGGPGAGGAGGGMMGGRGGQQVLEGTVEDYSDGKITLTLAEGGSAKVYVDTDTVLAAVQGKQPKVATGATLMVVATPEADGVTAASAIVVK